MPYSTGYLIDGGRFRAEQRRLDSRVDRFASFEQLFRASVEGGAVHEDAPIASAAAQADVRADAHDRPDALATRMRLAHLDYVAHPNVEGHRSAVPPPGGRLVRRGATEPR